MTRPKKGQPQRTNSPFKQLRLTAQLSQEQLARDIGVAVSTIRRWEKGQAEPTMTVLQMKSFCEAVNQTLDELPQSLLPLAGGGVNDFEFKGPHGSGGGVDD